VKREMEYAMFEGTYGHSKEEGKGEQGVQTKNEYGRHVGKQEKTERKVWAETRLSSDQTYDCENEIDM